MKKSLVLTAAVVLTTCLSRADLSCGVFAQDPKNPGNYTQPLYQGNVQIPNDDQFHVIYSSQAFTASVRNMTNISDQQHGLLIMSGTESSLFALAAGPIDTPFLSLIDGQNQVLIACQKK